MVVVFFVAMSAEKILNLFDNVLSRRLLWLLWLRWRQEQDFFLFILFPSQKVKRKSNLFLKVSPFFFKESNPVAKLCV